jgi:precorrin-2 dehydrogenase/sirohydrochlorin ferrochelatase
LRHSGDERENVTYYPAFLDLRGRRCLVVGGGAVALRKVEALLRCGAQVLVVAPDLSMELAARVRERRVEHQPREFRTEDLEGAFLVVAATDDAAANARVHEEAERRGLLVNTVDDPERCNFIVPSVIQHGPITVAISTGGASPALAKHLREQIERAVGPEHGALAELMGELRAEVKRVHADEADRRRAWQRILDSDVIDLLRAGRPEAARERARQCISSPPD